MLGFWYIVTNINSRDLIVFNINFFIKFESNNIVEYTMGRLFNWFITSLYFHLKKIWGWNPWSV